MAGFPWGAAIAAGGRLAGGFLGGGDVKHPHRHLKRQIQWRVNDAKLAGIHPLAALGATMGHPATGPITGSGIGDTISEVAGSIGQGVDQYGRRKAAQRAEAREERTSSAYAEMMSAQAELARARSRTLISERRENPAVTAVALDPSYVTDPGTGRMTMFRDASGKWQKVDTSVAPAEPLEREYGEVSELQGIARLLKSLPEFGGALDWPSLNDLREGATRWFR